jgi:hypothetical protein
MTRERMLEILNELPEGTEVLVKQGGILKRPMLNSEVINQSHFDKFPFYVPEDEIKPLLGKTVIIIE